MVPLPSMVKIILHVRMLYKKFLKSKALGGSYSLTGSWRLSLWILNPWRVSYFLIKCLSISDYSSKKAEDYDKTDWECCSSKKFIIKFGQ